MLKDYPVNIQRDIQHKYNLLLQEINISRDPADNNIIDKAFAILLSDIPAEKDLTGKYTIITTLETALIVVKEIGLGTVSVIRYSVL